MCLTRFQQIAQNKYGYKWVIKCEGKYYSLKDFHNYPDAFEYGKIGEEMGATNPTTNKNVEWGFHIFNRLNEAKESEWRYITIYSHDAPAFERVLMKVKYSFVRFTGVGDGLSNHYEIVVAEKMTLIEEVKL